MNYDTLLEAIACLEAQKEHMPDKYHIDEPYLNSFHEQLDKLKGAGYSFDQFRVPSDCIKPIQQRGGRVIRTGLGGARHLNETVYSKENYVERAMLLTRIDSLLIYLRLIIANNGNQTPFENWNTSV